MGLTRARNARISGTVRFDGKDLLGASDDDMRQIRGNDIAMIFQDPLSSLHPFYKVGTQIAEGVLAHRDVSKAQAWDRAVEMLSLVGIPEPRKRADAYPHEFSGGMRQRAMIAMALANDPKLLIADEPTTALDVTVQAQILELIERLQSEFDTAVVVITHDLGVVAEMADEIAVMYAGRIVEKADTDTIFAGARASLHVGAAVVDPAAGLAARRGARADRRPPAVADQPAERLLVPPALPVRARGAQAKVDPKLEPVPGAAEPRGRVPARRETRRKLWSELRQGIKPDEAREDVMEEEAGRMSVAAGEDAAGHRPVAGRDDHGGPRPRQALPDPRRVLPPPGRRGPGRRRRLVRRACAARRSGSWASPAAASRRPRGCCCG